MSSKVIKKLSQNDTKIIFDLYGIESYDKITLDNPDPIKINTVKDNLRKLFPELIGEFKFYGLPDQKFPDRALDLILYSTDSKSVRYRYACTLYTSGCICYFSLSSDLEDSSDSDLDI